MGSDRVADPGRRAFVGRAAGAAGVAAVGWAVPSIVSSPPVAAAVGSCSGVASADFASGLDGWVIDNSFGPGRDGLWRHSTERDGGALHYGRGIGRNFRTGNSRNSGAVTSPSFDLPSSGPLRVTFTVLRDVEAWPTDDYDVLRLSILGSSNATLWSAGSDGGTGGAFQTVTVTIPSGFAGQSVFFRFDFDTVDGLYNTREGVWVGYWEVTGCPTTTIEGASVVAFQGGSAPAVKPGVAPEGYDSYGAWVRENRGNYPPPNPAPKR